MARLTWNVVASQLRDGVACPNISMRLRFKLGLCLDFTDCTSPSVANNQRNKIQTGLLSPTRFYCKAVF